MGSFCKLCLNIYKSTKDPKRSLTDEILLRLNNIGIFFSHPTFSPPTSQNECSSSSRTICRKCFQGISLLEKADTIRESWKNSCKAKRRKIELSQHDDVRLFFLFFCFIASFSYLLRLYTIP